ncbi:MAG: CHASE4 domain-containing protein [Planctomycetota bacterium]
MQLRLKLTLLLATILTVSVVVNYAIQRFAIAPSFRALEHDDAVKDWERCRNAIVREREALSLACFDWSSWDHAYTFVQNTNPSFVSENLENVEWYTDQKIDLVYFCKPDGTVYWSHLASLPTGEPAVLAFMPKERLPAGHPLMAVTGTKESSVSGIARTELGLMILAARPILKSNNEGPLGGVLIFGRLITAEVVESLRAQTGVQFDTWDVSSESVTQADRAGMAAAIESDSPVEEIIDAQRLAVRGVMRAVDDSPVMLIKTDGKRQITSRGNGALHMATVSLLSAGLLTLGVLLYAMRWLVLEPLGTLTKHATHIGKSGRLEGRVDLKRGDELGTLARAFDGMLSQLEEGRANSVSLSRQAGMAEVAAGVLHNVGNAMTNVNVLADTLTSKLAGSAAPRLSKVSDLLSEHQTDLPGFFENGRPGQQIPAYLAQLASHLNLELADCQQDLAGLREGLQHVKDIVASHQGIASSSNFVEHANLGDVITKALHVITASLQRHGVGLAVEVESSVLVSCDRSKLSQVLVNLISNAKEALVGAKTPGPLITIRGGRGALGTAFVEISDNGPGVSPQYRDRLFSKGFTTKPDGHGIGLHFSWLAVREMNGTLAMMEPSGSTGAAFRLDLPSRVAQESVAA